MRNRWPYLLVGFVACIVTILNWPKGGMVMGWDNLMTQFDVRMNISRELSGVWQEYQGLGLLAGMGHAADLVRLSFEYLLSFAIPQNLIRTVEIFGSYILGGLGVVWLIGKLVGEGWRGKQVAQLIGGLFYLLSLGSVQNFWVPFEPYYWAYGFFPWLLGSYLDYLRGGGRKRLITFALISILATPKGYLQTVYLVCFILLMLFGVGYIFNQNSEVGAWKRMRRVSLAMIVSLIVNAFWLIPQLYFFATSVNVTTHAKMNMIATPEVSLSNQAVGDLWSVVTMNGYWLQQHDYQLDGSFDYLMKPWVSHLSSMNVNITQFAIVVIVIVGFLYILMSKFRWKYGVLLASLFCLMTLQGKELPFGYLNDKLDSLIPILQQIFRSSFTKIIVFWALLQTICIGVGLGRIYEWLSGCMAGVGKVLSLFFVFIAVGTTVYIAWPIFTGHLVYTQMKVELPGEYRGLFKFFSGVDNGRVALLPSETMWGWKYHKWGYDGSGFLWYGIEQPILDRAFDVWSPYNETFYDQLSTAFYGGQQDDVKRVLGQYDVKYVLLDESIIAPGQDNKILRIDETKKMAQDLGWSEIFHEGYLTVWEIPGNNDNQFVSAPSSYVFANGDTTYGRIDPIYSQYGTYVSTNKSSDHSLAQGSELSTTYPFADLMREEEKSITYDGDKIIVSSDLSSAALQSAERSELRIPGNGVGDRIMLGYTATYTDGSLSITWKPRYKVNDIDGQMLAKVTYPVSGQKGIWVKVGDSKQNGIYLEDGQSKDEMSQFTVGQPIDVRIYKGQTSTVDKLGTVFAPGNVQKCWDDGTPGSIARGTLLDKAIRLTAKDASACLAIQLAQSTHNELIQVIANHRSSTNIRPQLCLDEQAPPYECMNEDVRSEISASQDWDGFARTVAAKQGEQYWLDLSLQALQPYDRERTLDYQVPIVARYEQIDMHTIPIDAWKPITDEKTFEIKNKNLKIAVESKPSVYDLGQFGVEQPTNCDVLKRGTVGKTQSSDHSQTQGSELSTIYTADNRGAVCDYVEMPTLDVTMPYLMRLQGTDDEGRSVKIFLNNSGSQRNDLEYLTKPQSSDHSLTQGSELSFDQTFGLLPWDFSGHYTLNTETRSFGEPTRNTLKPVEVRYFPLIQLSRAQYVPGGLTESDIKHSNHLSVNNVTKKGTWLYFITVSGNGLLKLSQGYDKGWIGIGIQNGKGIDLQHVTVNGWANGWTVPDGTTQVIVFYWPQLLEYFGFALLAVTFILILKKKPARL